ncbi:MULTISPECIES: hypothetical protein [unclassified Curtobacterium]|nr:MULTISPECIES: hypothetical protein [unclassified Curtobacterium]
METDQQLRLEALDRSVRVNLSTGGNDSTEDTVKRAEAYLAFLKG